MADIPFGRYLLGERIAFGGTAEIFKAKLPGIEGFEKELVIKRILPHWSANNHFITMLIDEAKIMVKLKHEKIVQVYELGKEGENYYIVMEYVEGIRLKDLMEAQKDSRFKLQIPEVVCLILQLLEGLQVIHSQVDEAGKPLDIVHRDISPQNILLTPFGNVKITDFGIAHATSRSYETATGVLKGKFSYMAPEQARGERVGPKTDLFATGIIFYELLSNERLFSYPSDLFTLEKVKNFNTDTDLKWDLIPKEFIPVLKKALHPQQQDRYNTALDFINDIHKQFEQPSVSIPKELSEKIRFLQELINSGQFESLKNIHTQSKELERKENTSSLQESIDLDDSKNRASAPSQIIEAKIQMKEVNKKALNKKLLGGIFLICLGIIISLILFYKKREQTQTQGQAKTESQASLKTESQAETQRNPPKIKTSQETIKLKEDLKQKTRLKNQKKRKKLKQ